VDVGTDISAGSVRLGLLDGPHGQRDGLAHGVECPVTAEVRDPWQPARFDGRRADRDHIQLVLHVLVREIECRDSVLVPDHVVYYDQHLVRMGGRAFEAARVHRVKNFHAREGVIIDTLEALHRDPDPPRAVTRPIFGVDGNVVRVLKVLHQLIPTAVEVALAEAEFIQRTFCEIRAPVNAVLAVVARAGLALVEKVLGADQLFCQEGACRPELNTAGRALPTGALEALVVAYLAE